jgi:hypothetical protein
MQKKTTIGSEPSKQHYGGSPKDQANKVSKTKNSPAEASIVKGASEANLRQNKRG